MLSILPGVLLVVVITLTAGVIAYIGDRVGHQVGRKRLTLFGLRPKYTSTIVAVATGMLIALSLTLLGLAASGYVRTAFFRLGQLNAQINELQAQAVAAQQQLDTTRNKNIVLAKYSLIAPYGRTIYADDAQAAQLAALAALFDETVKYANSTYTDPRFGLLPLRETSSDLTVRRTIAASLAKAKDSAAASHHAGAPLFFLPEAYQNLFRGERIAFTFAEWADVRLVAANEALASVDVEGGKPLSQLIFQTLLARAVVELGRRDFPPPFVASPLSGADPTSVQRAIAELGRLRGHYRLVARSATDLYPHSGQYILTVSVEPRS